MCEPSWVRVRGPLHRETHYFEGPVFLSASSLAGLARFNNPPKAAFCARSSYALNVSEQVPMSASSTGDERAMNILRELHAAEKELVGRAVVAIRGHEGRWPISTVKHIES